MNKTDFEISITVLLRYLRILLPYAQRKGVKDKVMAFRNYNNRVFLIAENNINALLRVDITEDIKGTVEDIAFVVPDLTTVLRALRYISDVVRIVVKEESLFFQFYADHSFLTAQVVSKEPFFEIPDIGNPLGFITAEQKMILKKIGRISSKDDARPTLNGISVEKGRVVSTDGFRLGLCKSPAFDNFPVLGVIPNTILDFFKFMNQSVLLSKQNYENPIYWLSDDKFAAGFQLIKGAFPDSDKIYEHLDFKFAARINRSSLIGICESINRVISFHYLRDMAPTYAFFKDGNISLTIGKEDFAKFEIPYSVVYHEENVFKLPFMIAWSSAYVLSCLREIDSEYVVMHFSRDNDPIKIEAFTNEDFDLNYLVMPMHLG